MSPKDNSQIHRHVQLPDGRQVEVVHLDGDAPLADKHLGSAQHADREAPPLHICFHCKGKLVQPVDWRAEGRAWRLLLRCPECEATREGVFEQGQVDLFERELDLGVASLLADLKHITHANMSEQIAFFVRALEADIVGPSDF